MCREFKSEAFNSLAFLLLVVATPCYFAVLTNIESACFWLLQAKGEG
jgi:hypothetical protein